MKIARPPEPAAAGPVRRTRVAVRCVGDGPVRADLDVAGDPLRPALRPMLLSADTRAARVCLVPDGALLLAGDRIALDVLVGSGARLELVEAAGTVAHDMTGDPTDASWDVDIRLGPGSTLLWAGEPLVVAAGARVQRSTVVTMADGARLAVRETVVLGRHGERPGRLEQTWRAHTETGEPVFVEDIDLDAASLRPGILGGNRVLATVAALGVDVPADRAPDGRMDLAQVDPGRYGVIWRRLAASAHRAAPTDAWNAVLEACRCGR